MRKRLGNRQVLDVFDLALNDDLFHPLGADYSALVYLGVALDLLLLDHIGHAARADKKAIALGGYLSDTPAWWLAQLGVIHHDREKHGIGREDDVAGCWWTLNLDPARSVCEQCDWRIERGPIAPYKPDILHHSEHTRSRQVFRRHLGPEIAALDDRFVGH
jgi:hypothetical protein